ncbi:hypothetical protein V6N13_051687 [Hibiscus sabdariffa]
MKFRLEHKSEAKSKTDRNPDVFKCTESGGRNQRRKVKHGIPRKRETDLNTELKNSAKKRGAKQRGKIEKAKGNWEEKRGGFAVTVAKGSVWYDIIKEKNNQFPDL